jgi:hypothetical protein
MNIRDSDDRLELTDRNGSPIQENIDEQNRRDQDLADFRRMSVEDSIAWDARR